LHLEKLIKEYGCPKAIIKEDGLEFRLSSFQRVISKYRTKEVMILPGKLLRMDMWKVFTAG